MTSRLKRSDSGFVPVGIHSLSAAKFNVGDDWNRKPGDFNKKDLKSKAPTFHPPPIKYGDTKIPQNKAVIDQYAMRSRCCAVRVCL